MGSSLQIRKHFDILIHNLTPGLGRTLTLIAKIWIGCIFVNKIKVQIFGTTSRTLRIYRNNHHMTRLQLNQGIGIQGKYVLGELLLIRQPTKPSQLLA
jgi:hypothetical protein